MKDKKNLQEISLALMRKDECILIGLREDLGVWEFPGGKIQKKTPAENEAPSEALKRELKEELNIEASIGRLAGVCCYGAPQNKRDLLFYLFHVDSWKNQMERKVHKQLKWAAPEELPKLNLHDLNHWILPQIFSALRSS